MDVDILGYREPDEEWRLMKAVYDACRVAGIGMPDEVEEFFGGEEPREDGKEVSLSGILKDTCDGYELRVRDIPSFVTVIRVRWG